MTSHSPKDHRPERSMSLEHQIQRVDLLYRQNVAGWIAILINSAAYLFLSWGKIDSNFLIGWYVTLNGSAALRFLALGRWGRVRDRIATTQQLKSWHYFMVAMLLVSGACWGAIGWQFLNSPSVVHQVFTALLIAGMSAGALASYSPSFTAMYAVVLPAMIPWIVRMSLAADPAYHVMAGLAVIYTILMMRLGKNLNRYVDTALLATIEKAQLASDLEREVRAKEKNVEAFRQSEETLRIALESSSAMTWTWDIPNDQLVFQGSLQTVLGRQSFRGSLDESLSLVHPDDRSRFRSAIESAAATGGNICSDIRLIWPDGGLHSVTVRGQTIKNKEGQAIRVTGISIDVTAEKNQQILMRERDVFEAANKAKSMFLANASHEIRTPLAAINGFAESLLQNTRAGKLREEDKRDVQVILRNGKYLASLVNDLLDLSKIETGRLYIQKGHMSPKHEIEDSIQSIKSTLEERRLDLQLKFLTTMPEWIECDSLRFRQILTNLLSNAAKFTERGSIEIRASFEADKCGKGGALRVAVIDTGIGISDQIRESLFQPFLRGDTVEVQKTRGSGLGLALSRNLARCLGGDLKLVASTLGRGSAFEFTVLSNAIGGPMASPHRPVTEAARSKALSGTRILVVDDAADLRVLMRRFLERQGAEVETCDNGAEAIAMVLIGCENDGFDAILMDIKMPVMDGCLATKTLRKNGYNRPVIALTAHASDDDRKMCLEAGCDVYLSKPVDFDQLVETLKTYLPAAYDQQDSHDGDRRQGQRRPEMAY